jgi:hypothetical protein
MLALRRTGDIGVAEPAGTDLSVTPSGLNSRATLGGESQFLALSRRGRSTEYSPPRSAKTKERNTMRPKSRSTLSAKRGVMW